MGQGHAGDRGQDLACSLEKLVLEAERIEQKVGLGLGLDFVQAFGGLANSALSLQVRSGQPIAPMQDPYGDVSGFVAVYSFAASAAGEALEVRQRTGLHFGPKAGHAPQHWGWRLQAPTRLQSPLTLATAEGLLAAHIRSLRRLLAPLAASYHPRVHRVRVSYLPALERLHAQILRGLEESGWAFGSSFADFAASAQRPPLAVLSEPEAARRDLCQLLGLSPDDPSVTHAKLKSAYRRRAREIHPDKWRVPEAHAAFVALQTAHQAYDLHHADAR